MRSTSSRRSAPCVYQIGEQSTGITRNAWLGRGLAEKTFTVLRDAGGASLGDVD